MLGTASAILDRFFGMVAGECGIRVFVVEGLESLEQSKAGVAGEDVIADPSFINKSALLGSTMKADDHI